jgi:hypothetical protein
MMKPTAAVFLPALTAVGPGGHTNAAPFSVQKGAGESAPKTSRNGPEPLPRRAFGSMAHGIRAVPRSAHVK